MNNKLYVSNLPFALNDGGLANIFAPIGIVQSARVIRDRMSGRSKGFGFVEMASSEMAQVAIAQINGTQVQGRTIVVAEAKPQAERPQNNPQTKRNYGGQRNYNDQPSNNPYNP